MWLLSFLKEDPARAEILAGSLAEGEIYELWMRTVLTYMTHRCTIDSITVKSISFQKDMIRFLRIYFTKYYKSVPPKFETWCCYSAMSLKSRPNMPLHCT